MARRGGKKSRNSGSSQRAERTSQLRILWGLIRVALGRDGSGSFGLLWGLLGIRLDARGSWHLNLLWGLVHLNTPPTGSAWLPVESGSRRGRPRAKRGDDSKGSEDEVLSSAEAVAEAQLAAVRKACVLAGIALGMLALGALPLTGLFLALAGGILFSGFADRLRSRLLGREVEQAQLHNEVRRITAGEHGRDLQQLSASIAHEIRNPITAAKSLVQQMGEDPGATDNVEYARVALEELDRVEKSVSHLLRFAREEDLVRRPFLLSETVESALATLRDRIKSLGASIETELGTPGSMSGDPEKLRRVVLNLVGNALDAASEAGAAPPRVWIDLGENLAGTEVWLRIRDNGPGIAADDRERMFHPFQTGRKDGTGLGLAITRKLVEAHGGSIELDSPPGEGADFVLTFPRAEPASDPAG